MLFSSKTLVAMIGVVALLPTSEGRPFRRLTSLVEVPPGHEFDDSDLLPPAREGAQIENGQCWNKKGSRFHNIGDKENCQDLTSNQVRSDLVGKWCECQVYEGRPKWRPAGWIVPPTAPGDQPGECVNVQFFGNIVGHAKVLCQLVESIDCWQKKPGFKFPFLSSADESFDSAFSTDVFDADSTVEITTADGEKKFAAKADIIDTVRKICKVIDGGVDELPNLLPGLGDGGGGKLPGIPNLLGKIVKGLLGGIGGGGLSGLFDWFKNIFVFAGDGSVQSFAEGKIVLYDSASGPEE